MTKLDQRVAGPYEQTGDWPSTAAAFETVSRTLGDRTVLDVDGLCSRPRSLSYRQLVDFARADRTGRMCVPLSDLLAEVCLGVDAELLVVECSDGESLVLPVRDIVTSDVAQIVLGNSQGPLTLGQGFPMRLEVPHWTSTEEARRVVSLTAITFSEFVS